MRATRFPVDALSVQYVLMDATQVTTFFGLILIGATIGMLVALTQASLRRSLAESATELVAIVAVGATLGSLYLSEVANFVPCELCWFQRIAMYPIALIGTIAALRRDRAILPYTLALSLLGLGVSIYHIQLQHFPDQSSFCEVANPCTSQWVEAFGWMTIPQMAGISFALIATISALAIRSLPEPKDLS